MYEYNFKKKKTHQTLNSMNNKLDYHFKLIEKTYDVHHNQFYKFKFIDHTMNPTI